MDLGKVRVLKRVQFPVVCMVKHHPVQLQAENAPPSTSVRSVSSAPVPVPISGAGAGVGAVIAPPVAVAASATASTTLLGVGIRALS